MVAVPGISEWTLTVSERLALAGAPLWFYAGKLLWPTNLSFVYRIGKLRVHYGRDLAPAGRVGGPSQGSCGISGHASWARATTFALGYFIVALLPVLGFFDIYFFQVLLCCDHFQYLAGIG